MSSIKIILSILLAGILGSLIWALTLPANVHVEEKVIVNAPIEKVFSQVNNFHNWTNWSPYNDSVLHTKYEGSQEGVGAKMLWTDEKEGRSVQTIIISIPNEKVVTQLAFNDQKNEAQSHFHFKQVDQGVEVSWIMDVENLSFPFGRFVGYMIEKGAKHNFKKGLNKLKVYTEANISIPDYAGYTIHDEVLDAKNYLTIQDSGLSSELAGKMSSGFASLMKKMGELKITPKGYTATEWNGFNPEAISYFRCMIPVGNIKTIEGKIHTYTIASSRTIWIKYIGSYKKSGIAYETLDKYLEYKQLQMNGSPYEEYIVDPSTEKDSTKWITNIYFPVRDR
jgi:effector-binding domain-containing protein